MLDFLVKDDAGLKKILAECRTIAVVGLSSDPMRPSNDVASYLARAGYRIIPVNPNETEVLGVTTGTLTAVAAGPRVGKYAVDRKLSVC